MRATWPSQRNRCCRSRVFTSTGNPVLCARSRLERRCTLSVEDVQPPQMRRLHWPSLSAVEEGGEHHGPVDEDLDAERQPAALEDRDSEAPEDARGLGYALHDLPV